MNSMTLEIQREIISRVSYPGMEFRIHAAGHGIYLQVAATLPCNETGEVREQRGRKWSLTGWMTPTELVRTAHFAAQTFVMHEFNEQFKYRGVPIANTHIDVERLVEVAGHVDLRP